MSDKDRLLLSAALIGLVVTILLALVVQLGLLGRQAGQSIAHNQSELALCVDASTSVDAENCDRAYALANINNERDMLHWARAQSYLGLLSTFGLGLTILFACLAWRESRRSADAAEKTVKQFEAQSKTQLRAYLNVKEAKIEGKLMKGVEPLVIIEFFNSGQTPAYDVVVRMDAFVGDFPYDAGLREEGRHRDPSRGVVGANAPFYSRRILSGGVSVDDVLGFMLPVGNRAIWAIGRIDYTDVFGKSHWTTFRYLHGGNRGNETGAMYADSHGNEASRT